MASYHLSVKPVSRAQGRSATAAAAYRAAARIECEREGRVHDYTRRSGVAHTEIIVPVGAFVADRSMLWNAAEAAEKRKDARVAREFEIALPVELLPAARLLLAQQLAREIVERHGNAVDLAIHHPGDGDDRNHHAHLLTTTRQLGPDGFGAKCRELDDQKQGPKEIEYWRERWAVLQNQALERAGVENRVTHEARSYEEVMQGHAPTIHLGPDVAEMERRGVATERGDHNRAVAALNFERKSLLSLIAETKNQIRVMDAVPPAKVPVEVVKPEPVKPGPVKEKEPTVAVLAAALDQARQQLVAERQARLLAIQQKAALREKRRIAAFEAQVKTELQPPTGVTAALRQKGYEREHDRWRAVALPLQQLALQARALRERIALALQQVQQWASEKLRKEHPVAVARIEADRAEQKKREAAERPFVKRAAAMADMARSVASELQAGGPLSPGVLPPVVEAAERYRELRKTLAPPDAEASLARNLVAEAVAARQTPQKASGALLDRMATAVAAYEKTRPSVTKNRDQDLER